MDGTTRPDTAARDRTTRRVRVVTAWTGGLATAAAVGLGLVFAQDTAAAAAAQPRPVVDPEPVAAGPVEQPGTAVPTTPRSKSHASAPRTTAPRPPKATPKPAPAVSSGGAVHGSSGSS
jgi:outer membrane biosynthesis protein TonB